MNFFRYNLFFKFYTVIIINKIFDLIERSNFELFINKYPPLPFSVNSFGPLGQLLQIIVLLQNADSIITAPGSSHNEVLMTAMEFFINGKTLSI